MTATHSAQRLGELNLQIRQLTESATPKKNLYHYTSASGLCGMLEDGRIWASNIRHLNDFSELEYACRKLVGLIRKRLVTGVGLTSSTRTFLSHAESFFSNPSTFLPEAYIFSLCERDDVLSQWRSYGVKGGFSVELDLFDANGTWTLVPRAGIKANYFTKVEYDEVRQEDKLMQLLEKELEIFRLLLLPTGEGDLENVGLTAGFHCYSVAAAAAPLLYSFKHPAFEVEQECRIILLPERVKTLNKKDLGYLQFRTGNSELIPYVELVPRNGGKLPIRGIRVGPSQDPVAAKHAASLLLVKCGYGEITPTGSDIPVRL